MPEAPKSKMVTYIAVAIVVVGAVTEALIQMQGMFPDVAWLGKALMAGGVATKALHWILGMLNGGVIDAAAKAKLSEQTEETVKDKLGRP